MSLVSILGGAFLYHTQVSSAMSLHLGGSLPLPHTGQLSHFPPSWGEPSSTTHRSAQPCPSILGEPSFTTHRSAHLSTIKNYSNYRHYLMIFVCSGWLELLFSVGNLLFFALHSFVLCSFALRSFALCSFTLSLFCSFALLLFALLLFALSLKIALLKERL